MMKTKTAADIMTESVVTIRPDALLTDAIKQLLRYHISGLPVVDENEDIIGIITEHDVMNFAFSGDADTTPVKTAMTPDPFTFSPETALPNIVNCFASRHIRRVPIVENRKVVGIVSRRDILREMLFSLYQTT